MAVDIIITLTTVGIDQGSLFNLYSNVDGFNTPYEVGINLIDLQAGYLTSAPDNTQIVRVCGQSSLCNTCVDITPQYTTTTTTTTLLPECEPFLGLAEEVTTTNTTTTLAPECSPYEGTATTDYTETTTTTTTILHECLPLSGTAETEFIGETTTTTTTSEPTTTTTTSSSSSTTTTTSSSSTTTTSSSTTTTTTTLLECNPFTGTAETEYIGVTTTTSTTTQAPLMTSFLTATAPETSSSDACFVPEFSLTQTLYHGGVNTYPVVNDRIFTNEIGTIGFNGNGGWYKVKTNNKSIQIDSAGFVIDIFTC